MKLQGGSVYLVADLGTEVMGCVVRRMWWKPWRWSVQPIYYEEVVRKARAGMYAVGSVREVREVREVRDGEAIKDLTMLGAVGILKLYGVRHRDFECDREF